jgi:hypothetical protein
MKKLSTNTRLFLEYTFKGDGKYYTTEKGSMKYRNTLFSNFYNKNQDCIIVTSSGNDAPRGGMTGNFVHAIFTPVFFEKYGKILADLKASRQQNAANEKNKPNLTAAQSEQLSEFLKQNPDKCEKLTTLVVTRSSKFWRNKIKLKAVKYLGLEKMSDLQLTPVEIRNISFSSR